MATFSPIMDEDGNIAGISVVDKDISQRKKLELALRRSNAKLKELSLLDDLTQISNRRYLNEKLSEEMRRSNRYERPLACVMLDIDHFKIFNDAHGHPQGDRVLKELASILVENCRDVDTVARYGGEEFCILLPETGSAEALQHAERIRSYVEQHPFEGEELLPGGRLTISIGIAMYPEDSSSKNAIIECADRALYKAKQQGRNCVRQHSKMTSADVSTIGVNRQIVKKPFVEKQ
jgi:diguanylate cyclase (GGDEF)-like protein